MTSLVADAHEPECSAPEIGRPFCDCIRSVVAPMPAADAMADAQVLLDAESANRWVWRVRHWGLCAVAEMRERTWWSGPQAQRYAIRAARAAFRAVPGLRG